MRSISTIVVCFFILFFNHKALAAEVIIYESTFDSEPSDWVTDDESKFYWEASSSALYAEPLSHSPGYNPNRYFVTETELDPTQSFVLEGDIFIKDFADSGVVTFGLYADDLKSINQVLAGGARSDGTFNLELISLNGNRNFWDANIIDENRQNLGGGGFVSPSHELGVWYHLRFSYDAETETAAIVATNKDTGQIHRQRQRSGVRFNPAMRFVGVATHPQGIRGTAMSHADSSDGSATFLLDNVSLVKIIDNEAPSVTNLNQYKFLGSDIIAKGETIVGNTAVVKAEVFDPEGDDVQLEVELVPTDGSDTQTFLSEVASSGEEVLVELTELIPKSQHYEPNGNEQSFRWRARAIDSLGIASEWVDFGNSDNVDFTVRVVPLFTQVISEFPFRLPEEEWANNDYAGGADDYPGGCGRSIAQCGCAISSMVMLGQYYGIQESVDGDDVNPADINSWMEHNNGYQYPGLVKWGKAIEYLGREDSGVIETYLSLDHYNSVDINEVDDSLSENAPVLAYSNTYGHYFLIDSQIEQTYTVRDPRWYNTATLNDAKDISGEVQGYNNHFDKANIFTYHPDATNLAGEVYLYLASPAELLVTDPEGNQLGVNPVSSSVFEDIPNGTYTEEGNILSSDNPLNDEDIHFTKVIRMINATTGDYSIQVIGTGEGEYTLSSLIYDSDGNSIVTTHTSTTTANQIDAFSLDYTPDNLDQIDIIPVTPISVQELFTALKQTIKETEVKSKVIKALWLKQVELANYLYSKNKQKKSIRLLKSLKSQIKKASGKILSKDEASHVGEQVKLLIENLRTN